MTQRIALRWIVALFLASLAVRLLLAASVELAEDEAYYWVWSRDLQGGYLDHPPGVAVMIAASTKLLGATELGVRALGAVLVYAAMALVTALAHRAAGRNWAVTVWVAAALALGPLTAVASMIMTPDTPALALSAVALVLGLRVLAGGEAQRHAGTVQLRSPQAKARREEEPGGSTPLTAGDSTLLAADEGAVTQTGRPTLPLWAAFGAACGAALASKYTAVLLPVGFLLALLSSPAGRRQFLRPGLYLSILMCTAVFSPVILWNATHDWASVRFQLGHGLGVGEAAATIPLAKRLAQFGEYLGGQVLVGTPVLFVLGMIAIWTAWRRLRETTLATRFLLVSATLPLLFFAYSSWSKKVEMNWPAFAYLPMIVLIATLAAKSPPYFRWMRVGVIVAAAIAGGMQLPLFWWHASLPRVPPLERIAGWRALAATVDRHGGGGADGLPVYANRYQTAAILSFYLPGQPRVWSMNIKDRPNAYDYMPGRPAPRDLAKNGGVVFVLHANTNVPLIADATGTEVFRNVRHEAAFYGRRVPQRDYQIVILSRPEIGTTQPTTKPADPPK